MARDSSFKGIVAGAKRRRGFLGVYVHTGGGGVSRFETALMLKEASFCFLQILDPSRSGWVGGGSRCKSVDTKTTVVTAVLFVFLCDMCGTTAKAKKAAAVLMMQYFV